MATKCPACGSADIQAENVDESLPVPYGPAATFSTIQYTCNTCGESGDFTGENTAIINEALQKSISVSASTILEQLSAEGISAAYFERAMRLPSRTTARWKSGELSAAALALLRLVCTYPWLLEVSDADFESSVSKSKLLEAAAGVVASVFKEKVSSGKVDVSMSSNQVNIDVKLQLHGQDVVQVTTGTSEQFTYLGPVALLSTG